MDKKNGKDKTNGNSGSADRKEGIPSAIGVARALLRGSPIIQFEDKESAPEISSEQRLNDIFPVSSAVRREAERKAEEKVDPAIGQMVSGKGIYAGTWQPVDRDGQKLGQIFNVYAAPEDLRGKMNARRLLFAFDNAVRRVADLRSWHGHNGGNFEDDKAVLTALWDGDYRGEWFIPTREILRDNLYANKDRFTGTGKFVTTRSTGNLWDCYWSCTRAPKPSTGIWHLGFMNNYGDWSRIKGTVMAVRPVRLERRPG